MLYAPVQTDRTADSVQELLGVLQQFQGRQPAEADELNRVVRSSIYSLPGQYETNSAVLNALLANQRFNRTDDYVSSLPGQFQALALEQVQATGEQVLHPEALTWVIVGDAAHIRPSLEKLGIAPVQAMDSDGTLLP